MGRNKSRHLPLGVISSGTHVTEALFDAYYDALDGLQLSRETRKRLNQLKRVFAKAKNTNEETRMACLDELTMMMEDHAPYGAYFGTHEGDGALFGVWPDWDYLTEEEHQGYLKRGDELPKRPPVTGLDTTATHFLLVNDHGNTSLYRWRGNKWNEVWGVV